VASLKDTLLNQGLQFGMSAVQKLLNSPIGPAVMRSVSELLKLRQQIEEAKQSLLERMQIASASEQDELRRQVTTLEKKLERMERRLRELQKQTKEN
jgi:predicted phage-related endonuclease